MAVSSVSRQGNVMALRVTQQSVDVLSEATGGKLRVTQFYVEVLGTPGAELSVSDPMSLTHSATEVDIPAGSNISASASSTATISDAATERLDPGRSISDPMSLTSVATEVIDHVTQSVTSTLALSGAAVETDLPIQSASNAMALTDSAVPTGDRQVSASNTLALTDAATLPQVSASASSDLSGLTDSAVATGIVAVSPSHTLAFTQDLTNGVILVSVNSAMSLVQTPYAGQNVIASASSAMAFTQGETPGIYFASGSDVLAAIDEALGDTGTNTTRFLTDPMSLTQSATAVITDFIRSLGLDPPDLLRLLHTVQVAGPKLVSVSDVLGLTNIPSQHQGIANVTIHDFLNFQHITGRALSASAADVLTLSQIAFRRMTANDVLFLTQTASGFIARPGVSILALTDAVSRIFVAHRSLTDNLGLNSSVAAFLDDARVRCQYHPFIGGGPGTSIPATMPTLGNAKVTLTYPFVSPSTTLVLRNPQFGNIDRLSFDRINRETRGGTLIMFVDPKWPKQQVMNVTITALKRSQKDALLAFFNTSIGQDIGYLDHENRLWRGIILTPEAIITNNDRGGYTVTFEFEGTLQ